MFNSMMKMAGFGGPSDEEKAKLFEANFVSLRTRCRLLFEADPAQEHTEASMKRFLRAFLTVDDAFNGIIHYNNWRRDYGVEDLKGDDPHIAEQIAKNKARLLRPRDRKGRPIVHVQVKNHITGEVELDHMTKFVVYMLEQTANSIDETVIDNTCVVFDLKDFSMSNMDYQVVKQLINLLNRYYPERLGVCIILNYPTIFSGCWAAIRPWLNEVTASKVQFVSDRKQLSQYLNPDVLKV